MRIAKLAMLLVDPVARFADDFDVADHSINQKLIRPKISLRHIANVGLDDRWLPQYGRDNPAGEVPCCSYRLRLGEHSRPEVIRQSIRRQHVYRDAEQIGQLVTNDPNVNQ